MAFYDQPDQATVPDCLIRNVIQQSFHALRKVRYGIGPYPGCRFSTCQSERFDGKLTAENACYLCKRSFAKVQEENQEPKKKNDPPNSAVYITAPDHQLRNLKKHQQNLLDSPKGSPGSVHEKAQLLSNKTHYSRMIRMRGYRSSPAKPGK